MAKEAVLRAFELPLSEALAAERTRSRCSQQVRSYEGMPPSSRSAREVTGR